MSPLTLFLFQHELDSMDEYSTTLPTATTIGKMWKRNANAVQRMHERPVAPNWHVCMYVEHEDPTRVRILRFEVVLRHGPEPRCYVSPDWSNFAGWKAERARESSEKQCCQ